jgi:hypothetical protein
LFSTFPGGSPGFGLLILRIALGFTGLFRGAGYLSESGDPVFSNWLIGLLVTAVSIFLLVGFLTPISSALIIAGVILSFAAGQTISLAAGIYAVAQATAIVLLGPGAFSLDARFFGRREIVIPKNSSVPHG